MKHKTIELIIRTELPNEEILKILNNGTHNLAELGIQLLEIRVVGSANSLVRGVDYDDEKDGK